VSRIASGSGPLRRCLGPELTAYADRALSPAELRSWDRHLVACACCRQAVEAEKRVLTALRATAGPGVPSDLRAVLLSMASTGDRAERPAGAPRADGLPAGASAVQPLRIPPPPVPVVDRCAPALHRSAMRATVFAGLAAGASAAAAWSFAVVGGPLAPTSPAAPAPAPGTAVQRARPASPSFTTASFGASLRARPQLPVSATTVFFSGAGRPVVSGTVRGSAQSLP
jgi:hypothetical protein